MAEPNRISPHDKIMRTQLRPLLVLAALLAAGGCSHDPTSPSVREIEAHQAVWQAQHLSSYTFTFQQQCFCAPIITQPATVTVRAGQVVSVVSSTGEPVTPEMRALWPTIDQLFDRLKEERQRGQSNLTIRWNEQRAYPTAVRSSLPNVADGDYDLSVTGLQPAS